MNRSSRQIAVGIIGAAMLVSGCRDDRFDKVIADQTQQQAIVSDQLSQLESRLLSLEKRPRLDFTLINLETSINEKMFTPLVEAGARLSVKGDNMPPTFYVDVMLKVEVPDIKYESIERQIFPVVDGKGKLLMQQNLPQHGLKPEQVQVTLKPMTWYRGQIINDDMVNYR